jgi:hypothetical protein
MTDHALRAQGFSAILIVGLVGAGYAEAKPRTMNPTSSATARGAATGKIGWPHDNLPGGFEPTFRD